MFGFSEEYLRKNFPLLEYYKFSLLNQKIMQKMKEKTKNKEST
jgi:hypothetical protein